MFMEQRKTDLIHRCHKGKRHRSTGVRFSATGQTHHSCEEPEGLEVLEDVAGLGGDEQHVELLHGLVHVAHRLRLHEGVLLRRRLARPRRRRRAHQLGEGGKQALDPRL